MMMRRLSPFAVCVAIVGLSFIAGADDKKTVPEPKSIFLVEVVPKANKVEVKGNKLLGGRIHIRFQPSIYYIDRKTGKKVVLEDCWVLDITDDDGKFSGDPLGLRSTPSRDPIWIMEVGSVVPGYFLGANPEDEVLRTESKHKYVLTTDKGPLATRWKKLGDKPVCAEWEEKNPNICVKWFDKNDPVEWKVIEYYSDHREPNYRTFFGKNAKPFPR